MRRILSAAILLGLLAVAGCDRGVDHSSPPSGGVNTPYGATGKYGFVGPSKTSFGFEDAGTKDTGEDVVEETGP